MEPNASATRRRSEEPIEYVVQVQETVVRAMALVDLDDAAGGKASTEQLEQLAAMGALVAWVDVATVKVAPRTKLRTVVARGLAEAGIELTPELEARVLPPAAAYVWRAKAPEPPTLRLI